MRKVNLVRNSTGDQGTFGTITTDSGFSCRSGELPWRDNLPNESCIPLGKYLCSWRKSPTHGFCYHVDGVPARTGVEIHAANFMGDRSKNLRCELLGCIAPAMFMEIQQGQLSTVESRYALSRLERDLGYLDFDLTIDKDF